MNITRFFRFITSALCVAFAFGAAMRPAHAKLATVGAVHDYVRARWGINVPYRNGTAGQLFNMHYLMQLVDAANLALNGVATSNYANDEKYASSALAATTTSRNAVDRLIKNECNTDSEFCFIPETTGNVFNFKLGAMGTFEIDWGDGQTEIISPIDTKPAVISHTYSDAAGNHLIHLRGKATAYDASNDNSTIMFAEGNDTSYRLKNMRGCLGCVFSTLADGSQPKFKNTFIANGKLNVPIPENLFNGIDGQPTPYMFNGTFYNSGVTGPIPEDLFVGVRGEPVAGLFGATFRGARNLTGDIPEGLFRNLRGAPANGLFSQTFLECAGLTGLPGGLFAGIKGAPTTQVFFNTFGKSGIKGEIPENLFEGLEGPPASHMFYYLFEGCKGLTGEIPENLFSGIKGKSAGADFQNVFSGCTGLTGEIPAGLFKNIEPTSASIFNYAFSNCSGLSGPSVKFDGRYLYEIWPDAVTNMYSGVTGLSDYACIPTSWGGAGTKQPGECEPVVEAGDDGGY